MILQMHIIKELMKRSKELIKPYYHKFQRLYKAYRRIGLKCKDFSIVSNNCTGGYVYQYFGIVYNTPTEGLYFTTEDYIKLIKRPKHYFEHEVILIDPHQSVLAKAGKNIYYPVGVIDDIEVYFMHYHKPEEALNKWYRRASRINYNKLFFLLTETELMEDEHLKQFSEIIESYASNNGGCLTLTDYDYKHSLYVPNVPKDKKNGNAAWKPNIIISVLNWKKILNSL